MRRCDDIPQFPRLSPLSHVRDDAPGWVCSLHRLYDGVAAQPLPDEFSTLVARVEAARRQP